MDSGFKHPNLRGLSGYASRFFTIVGARVQKVDHPITAEWRGRPSHWRHGPWCCRYPHTATRRAVSGAWVLPSRLADGQAPTVIASLNRAVASFKCHVERCMKTLCQEWTQVMAFHLSEALDR